MYLVDTNVWLERLLDQARSEEVMDFDDAYQYAAVEKHQLVIVSFDGDFDRTERGRKTPAEILQG